MKKRPPAHDDAPADETPPADNGWATSVALFALDLWERAKAEGRVDLAELKREEQAAMKRNRRTRAKAKKGTTR